MEAYLTLCLFSLLNMKEVKWAGFAATEFSNVFSYIIFPLTLILPVLIFVYYFKQREHWAEEDFKKKAGGFVDGIRHDPHTFQGKYTYREVEFSFDGYFVTPTRTQVNLMIWQALFFIRRLALCWSLVFLNKNFWGQTFIQYITSIGYIIFIQYCSPLEGRFNNNIQTFNECTIIFILYCLMHFTDFVNDPGTRNSFGSLYIVVLIIFTIVHFYFICMDTCRNFKLRIMQFWMHREILIPRYKARARYYWQLARNMCKNCCKKK